MAGRFLGASPLSLLVASLAGCVGAESFPGDIEPTPRDPPSARCDDLPAPEAISTFGSLTAFEPVVHAATPPPPISGGTLAVTASGALAIAADPDRDQVYVVDLDTATLLATVPLLAGDEPGRVAIDGDLRAYVALRRGGGVAVIDLAARALATRYDVCAAPRGLALDAGGATLLVACDGGELFRLDAATGTMLLVQQLEPGLRDVVVGDTHIYVSIFRTAEVLALEPESLELADRMRPAVARRPVRDGGADLFQAFEPSQAWRMVEDGRGGIVLLHQRGKSSEIRGIEEPGAYGSIDNGCQVTAGALTPWRAGEPVPEVAGIATAMPVDVALTPGWVVVASGALGGRSSTVDFGFDARAAHQGFSDECRDGEGWLDSGTTGNRDAAIAVAFRGPELLVQHREPATLRILRAPDRIPATVLLAASSVFDTGHALFHFDPGTGIACASCHGEGHEDGRTWNTQCVGPRRTPSLHGGLSSTAPFHWDGAMNDLNAIMGETFVRRMSGGLPTLEQVAALTAWIDTLQPPPASPAVDVAAVERGQGLFEAVSTTCNQCHSGSHFTNNLTVDVGTGRALQVPSLVGVSRRFPYMHDGCGATLREALTQQSCGGNHQAATAALSAGELDDLVAYLASL